jgi:tetratricopeptide (TPR) repeat protein
LYASRGELDKAVDVYQKGITAAPDNPSLSLGLAGIHERQQRHDDAIAVYEKMLEKYPDNLLVINNLAALLSDHREDEASLSRARELAGKLANSDQPALLDTLGWVHYRLGEYDQAAEVLIWAWCITNRAITGRRRRFCQRLSQKSMTTRVSVRRVVSMPKSVQRRSEAEPVCAVAVTPGRQWLLQVLPAVICLH